MTDIELQISKIQQELPSGVTLVAVSKFHPIEAIKLAYSAGQRIFGESRAQELDIKYPLMPKDVQWHFIGHLQTNKVKSIIKYVSLIHSVDSLKLLETINNEAQKLNLVVNILLQLHVAKEEAKFGFTPEECMQLYSLNKISKYQNIKVCGVMGMATNTDDENEIRKEFQLIRSTFKSIKANFMANDNSFSTVSMGMSGDYKIAIEEGSNMVRIGTSIFGEREY